MRRSGTPSRWTTNFVGYIHFPLKGKNTPIGEAVPAPKITYSGVYAGMNSDDLDTNLLAARPVKVNPNPKPTLQLYLEIEFHNDANGVNHGYFNGITVPGDPNAHVPLLVKQLSGLSSTPKYANSAQACEGCGAGSEPPTATVKYSNDGKYHLPIGSAIEFFINNTGTGTHPIHMHGHTFWIVATSQNPQAEVMYRGNYITRDTVSILPGGWAKIIMVADNPGIWAMHCHIEWHVAAGLLIQMYEGVQQLQGQPIPSNLLAQCSLPVSVEDAKKWWAAMKWWEWALCGSAAMIPGYAAVRLIQFGKSRTFDYTQLGWQIPPA